MVLGRVTREVRDAVLAGKFALEDGEEDFGWDGIECEVKGCTRRSERFLDFSQDDGRNLCLLHMGVLELTIFESAETDLMVRVRWDDGTTSQIGSFVSPTRDYLDRSSEGRSGGFSMAETGRGPTGYHVEGSGEERPDWVGESWREILTRLFP